MKHRDLFLLRLLVLTAFSPTGPVKGQPHVENGDQLYVVGNSYTCNNGGMPNYLVRALASGDPPTVITFDYPASGCFYGQGLSSMFTPAVQNDIATGGYDIVQYTSGDVATMTSFFNAATNAGAFPLIFMTWEGSHPTDQGQNWTTYRNGTLSIINACRQMESDTGVLVAPAGAVLYDLLADPIRAGLRADYVFEPANIHQNMIGGLVNCYTIYAVLTGQSPVGISFDYDPYVVGSTLYTPREGTHTIVFDEDFRIDLQDRVWQVVQEWQAGTFVVKPVPSGNNQRPTAFLEASTTSGFTPLPVVFDASTSSDPDGDPLAFDWDFGDGEGFQTGTATESRTFTTAGTYRIGVRASDGSRRDADYVWVKVFNAGENRSPVAKLTASSLGGGAPLEVSFDASSSTDPDGDTLTFAWNFSDGRGFVPGAATASFAFSSEGSYAVQVLVSDGQLTATESVSIQVTRGFGTYYRIDITQGASGAWGNVREIEFLAGTEVYPDPSLTGPSSAVSGSGSNAWRAFDGVLTATWELLSPLGNLSIYLGPQAIPIEAVRILVTEANRGPGAFTVEASADGVNWTRVGAFTGNDSTRWASLDRTFELDRFFTAPAPSILTTQLPDAVRGLPYEVALEAEGGQGSLQWTVTAGSLPVGWNLSTEGIVTGLPSQAGVANFTITVTDADLAADSQSLTLRTIEAVWGVPSREPKWTEHGWIWDAPYPFIYAYGAGAFAWVYPGSEPASIFLYVFDNPGHWCWTGTGYGLWHYVFNGINSGWRSW